MYANQIRIRILKPKSKIRSSYIIPMEILVCMDNVTLRCYVCGVLFLVLWCLIFIVVMQGCQAPTRSKLASLISTLDATVCLVDS